MAVRKQHTTKGNNKGENIWQSFLQGQKNMSFLETKTCREELQFIVNTDRQKQLEPTDLSCTHCQTQREELLQSPTDAGRKDSSREIRPLGHALEEVQGPWACRLLPHGCCAVSRRSLPTVPWLTSVELQTQRTKLATVD